ARRGTVLTKDSTTSRALECSPTGDYQTPSLPRADPSAPPLGRVAALRDRGRRPLTLARAAWAGVHAAPGAAGARPACRDPPPRTNPHESIAGGYGVAPGARRACRDPRPRMMPQESMPGGYGLAAGLGQQPGGIFGLGGPRVRSPV